MAASSGPAKNVLRALARRRKDQETPCFSRDCSGVAEAPPAKHPLPETFLANLLKEVSPPTEQLPMERLPMELDNKPPSLRRNASLVF